MKSVRPERELGGSGAIFETLSHHDGQLKELNARIGGVESSIVSIDKKFDNSYHETSSQLKEIQKTITLTQARQGPGFINIIFAAGGCAAILTAITAGITMLVGSQVSPSISTLQTTTAQLSRSDDSRQQAVVDELRDLKKDKALTEHKFYDEISDRLRALESQMHWSPTVTMSKR